MYYDVPVISLRNALMPQLLAAPEIRPTYHAKTWDGKTDFRHVRHALSCFFRLAYATTDQQPWSPNVR